MLDNWREHNECSPWVEEGNYYIVVESDHQSPGNDTERDDRFADAKLKGVDKLFEFYGKVVHVPTEYTRNYVENTSNTRPGGLSAKYNHVHEFTVDANGNGSTAPGGDNSHTHQISNSVVSDGIVTSDWIDNNNPGTNYSATHNHVIGGEVISGEHIGSMEQLLSGAGTSNYADAVVSGAAVVEDYFVGYKPFTLMKVLIKVPQSVFDQIPDDTSSCDVVRPEEGYIETSISVYNFAEQISFIVDAIESYIPAMSRSSRFISNINILAELKRLRQASIIIERYLLRNNIISERSQFISCEPEFDKRLKIGYNFAYEGIYALVDDEQHTIGYHCFINNETINHLTTANYLVHLDSMHEMLTSRDSNTFDIFAFLSRFTLPVSIIRTKEKQTDGLSLYADKGVSFGFADLAKIISLDIDINLCKSDEDVADEDRRFLDPETRKNLLESAKSIKKFAGDMSLSSENVEGLKDRYQNMRGTSEIPHPIVNQASERQRTKALRLQGVQDPGSTSTSTGESREVFHDLWIDDEANLYANLTALEEEEDIEAGERGVVLAKRVIVDAATGNMTEGEEIPVLPSENVRDYRKATQPPAGKEALKTLYKDVLSKIDVACLVNDALQCYVDRTIALVGEQVLDSDEELGEVINASISLGEMVNARCEFEKCNGSPDIDVSIGFPIFQGIQIPDNFPTFDYLAGMIDAALNQLYAALVNMLVSAILRILQNSCEVLFDDALGEGDAVASVKEGFQDWLGESIGIDYEDLNNSRAWGDALTTTGGTGFIGAVGNLLGRGIASGYATVEDTGVALNLPNPEKGWQVEEYLVSTASVYKFLGDLRTASHSINAVTSEQEQVLLYQGTASEQTKSVVYNCLKIQNPAFSALFKDKYELADLLSAMGRLVKPEFLEHIPDTSKSPPPDFCHLGDGSDARAVREALLSEKDPELTEGEMNNIINKEIAHNTKKIQELQSTLQDIMNGSLSPSFPSLFGGSNSLVPSMPPTLKEICMIAIDGPLGMIVTNFSLAGLNYANVWKQLYVNSGRSSADYPGNGISPGDLFYRMESNLRAVGALTRREWKSPNEQSITDYKDKFSLGYFLPTDATPSLEGGETTETLLTPTNNPIVMSVDLNVGGVTIRRLNSDVIKYGPIGVDDTGFYVVSKKTGGEDVQSMIQMMSLLGWGGPSTPYVLKRHPKDNRNKDMPWNEHGDIGDAPGPRTLEWLYDNAPPWYTLTQILEKIWYKTHERVCNVSGLPPPVCWWRNLKYDVDGVYRIYQFDSMGTKYPWWVPKTAPDQPDEILVEWQYNSDDENVRIWLTTIHKTETTDDTVPPRDESAIGHIVRYNQKPEGVRVKYDEADYRIGTSPHFLGRKLETGHIVTNVFATTGDGSPLLARDGNFGIPVTVRAMFGRTKKQELEDVRPALNTMFAEYAPSSANMSPQWTINTMTDDMFQQFAKRINNGKYSQGVDQPNALVPASNESPYDQNPAYYTESNFDSINLVYNGTPATDILGYNELREFASHLSTLALTLGTKADSQQHPDTDQGQVGDLADVYCDIISPTRRVSTITTLAMLIRLFIVERALISIHVFNGFDLGFMYSEVFISSIFDSLKNELNQYKEDFNLNDITLWRDVQQAALKYYEMLRLDGDAEIPNYSDKEGYQALRQFIRDEVAKIRKPIKNVLDIQAWQYNTWDKYLSEKVFGEIVVTGKVAGAHLTGGGTGVGNTPWGDPNASYKAEYMNHDNLMNLYSRYARPVGGTTNVSDSQTLPTFIFHKIYDPQITSQQASTYGYELIFLWWTPIGTPPELQPQFKSVVIKQCEADFYDENGHLRYPTNEELTEIWLNLRTEVWNSPEYQELFYSIFPIQDMIAALSLYEYAALSDRVYFPPTYYGINLHDMLARTKLSAIQTFTSAKYGFRNINYEDPYEKKAGVDVAPLSDVNVGG